MPSVQQPLQRGGSTTVSHTLFKGKSQGHAPSNLLRVQQHVHKTHSFIGQNLQSDTEGRKSSSFFGNDPSSLTADLCVIVVSGEAACGGSYPRSLRRDESVSLVTSASNI